MSMNYGEEIMRLMKRVPMLEEEQILSYIEALDGGEKTRSNAAKALRSLSVARRVYNKMGEKYYSIVKYDEVTIYDRRFMDMFWVILEYMPDSTQFDYDRERVFPLFFVDAGGNTINQVCYIPAGQEHLVSRRIYENTNLKWDSDNIRFGVVENRESVERLKRVGFRYLFLIDHETENREDKIEIVKSYSKEDAWGDMTDESL